MAVYPFSLMYLNCSEEKCFDCAMKRATDTSSECRKKNIPTQKNSDMFRLFFGVVVGSTNAFGLILILTA
jgi:hypothetical protein